MFTNSLRWSLVCACLAGCSGKQSALVPVRGRVTLNDAPVKEVIVNFGPIKNTAGSGALGATDDDGQFELTDVRGKKGAHPGDYKIHLYPAPLGKASSAPADVVSAGGGGGKVPAIYINPINTPLVASVPETGGFVEVTLTPDGKNARTTTTNLPE